MQTGTMTVIERTEDYEAPALEWMFGQVERLRRALSAAGVADESVQRSVCESFLFDLAMVFDDADATAQPRPRLAFEHDGTLLLPDDDSFDFHNYAFGVVGEAFGDS